MQQDVTQETLRNLGLECESCDQRDSCPVARGPDEVHTRVTEEMSSALRQLDAFVVQEPKLAEHMSDIQGTDGFRFRVVAAVSHLMENPLMESLLQESDLHNLRMLAKSFYTFGFIDGVAAQKSAHEG